MAFQDSAQSVSARLHLGGVKKWLLVAALAVIAVIVAALTVLVVGVLGNEEFSVVSQEDPVTSVLPDEENNTVVESVDQAVPVPRICVHVSGCVVAPGVYYLDEGSRVHEAISAAGGFSEEASSGYVNEARVLSDGEQVVIPSAEAVEELENSRLALGNTGSAVSGNGGLVNINIATAEQLQSLNGIGEVTAEKIIADREQNGPFASIEDIQRVSGIGEKKFAALRESICV
ncbi:MAG: helix-hairpin-helix domain-containing protein [Eggerthellaceae bacterium]|nr:helix-hairpin-helix domain-containing protein [Eggerthellaceae bacterium]